MVIAAVFDFGAVRLIETASGRELATLRSPALHEINALQFAPDGTQLAVVYASGLIHFWDLKLIKRQLAAITLDWDESANATSPRLP